MFHQSCYPTPPVGLKNHRMKMAMAPRLNWSMSSHLDTATYEFLGLFETVKQVGDGNCAYYVLAGISEPATLSYARMNGKPKKQSDWRHIQRLAKERREFTAHTIERYTTNRIVDEGYQKALEDLMMEQKKRCSTLPDALQYIRTVCYHWSLYDSRRMAGVPHLISTCMRRKIGAT